MRFGRRRTRISVDPATRSHGFAVREAQGVSPNAIDTAAGDGSVQVLSQRAPLYFQLGVTSSGVLGKGSWLPHV